jgi:hypothetical protein
MHADMRKTIPVPPPAPPSDNIRAANALRHLAARLEALTLTSNCDMSDINQDIESLRWLVEDIEVASKLSVSK